MSILSSTTANDWKYLSLYSPALSFKVPAGKQVNITADYRYSNTVYISHPSNQIFVSPDYCGMPVSPKSNFTYYNISPYFDNQTFFVEYLSFGELFIRDNNNSDYYSLVF